MKECIEKIVFHATVLPRLNAFYCASTALRPGISNKCDASNLGKCDNFIEICFAFVVRHYIVQIPLRLGLFRLLYWWRVFLRIFLFAETGDLRHLPDLYKDSIRSGESIFHAGEWIKISMLAPANFAVRRVLFRPLGISRIPQHFLASSRISAGYPRRMLILRYFCIVYFYDFS